MAQLTRRFHLPSALRPSDVRIGADRAHDLVASGALLIDVRRQDDPGAQIAGALRITPDVIPDHVPDFPENGPIVLACT